MRQATGATDRTKKLPASIKTWKGSNADGLNVPTFKLKERTVLRHLRN
jgi:hypothetical protein